MTKKKRKHKAKPKSRSKAKVKARASGKAKAKTGAKAAAHRAPHAGKASGKQKKDQVSPKATAEKPARQKKKKSFKGWNIFASTVLAVAVALCVLISAQLTTQGYVRVAGFSVFRVVTGSMEPTISVGEAILCRSVPIEDVQAGDIVCYRSEVSEIKGAVVTHRVMDVTRDRGGDPALKTMGDANLTADPDLVGAEALIGRVVWHSGKEGVLTKTLSFLTGEIGFLICIVFPTLLAAGLILQGTVRSLRREIKRVKGELSDERSAHAEPPHTPESAQPDEAVVPGYTLLTWRDYNEILRSVKAELIEEKHNAASDTNGHKTAE